MHADAAVSFAEQMQETAEKMANKCLLVEQLSIVQAKQDTREVEDLLRCCHREFSNLDRAVSASLTKANHAQALLRRIRIHLKAKQEADDLQDKYYDIEVDISKLEAEKNEVKLSFRRRRNTESNLRKKLASIDEKIRSIRRNPAHKRIEMDLAAAARHLPELVFFEEKLDPLHGTCREGRRLRRYEEYDDVVPLEQATQHGSKVMVMVMR